MPDIHKKSRPIREIPGLTGWRTCENETAVCGSSSGIIGTTMILTVENQKPPEKQIRIIGDFVTA